MCGISLFVDKVGNADLPSIADEMNQRARHRGPDGEGVFEGSNFVLGHRRLSIVDVSAAGHQPMRSGDDWISFNGMIYNYVELRQELERAGCRFHSSTDTEVLLAACRTWGIDAFSRLNGMWAFVWYRAELEQLVLCRDHFGIKPLVYTDLRSGFAAASEIKQLTVAPGFRPALNEAVVLDFLVDGVTNASEQTFFSGVYELRAGHYLTYDLKRHRFETRRWYDLEAAIAAASSPADLADPGARIREHFVDSLKKRMRSDVTVGSCLSGGIDSSAIVGELHREGLTRRDFLTVTSCFEDQRFDEQAYSDQVSQATGLPARKVFPDMDALLRENELDRLIFHQEQPFSSATHFAEQQVFQDAASVGIKVMLSGQGSDEFFCGYDEYFPTFLNQLLRRGKLKLMWRNLRSRARLVGSDFWTQARRHLEATVWHPSISRLKPLIGKGNCVWLHPDLSKRVSPSWRRRAFSSIRELSLDQMLHSSLPAQLHSEDRNSMAHGIESRLPFLDRRLVEYAMRLPDHLKIRDGFSKHLLRSAIGGLPEAVRNRVHKMGFVAPDETWVRRHHRAIRDELVAAVEETGFFSAQLLRRFDAFVAGERNYEPIYIRALTLRRFMNLFGLQLAKILEFPREIAVRAEPGLESRAIPRYGQL